MGGEGGREGKGVAVIVFSFYKSSSNIGSHEIKENQLLYLL